MKKILFFVLLFIISSCVNKYSKKHHVTTLKIDSNLYNEVYQVYSGGVFANDSYSNYITDNKNFRKYVGTVHYDDEQIYCDVINNNVVRVVLRSKRNISDTIDVKYYKIDELISNGEFD